MKVLLDEMMPVDLRLHLPGHQVLTVSYMGWKSVRNGLLMGLMLANGFEAMITNDRQMRNQQAPSWVKLPIVVTHVKKPKLPHMLKLVPDILRLLATRPPPGFHHVHGPATP